jgi:hypothetical protein
MKPKISAFAVSAMLVLCASSVAASPASVPTNVTNTAGAHVDVQPVLCVDLTGAYLACGGSGGGGASVSTTGAAVPGSANYFGMNVGGNLTGVIGSSYGLYVGAMSGAYADGSIATLGAKADSYQTDATQTATQMAILKGMLYELEQPSVLAGANSTARIGTVTTDQTTPGITDLVHNISVPSVSAGVSTYAALGGTGNALLGATATQISTSAAHAFYFWHCQNQDASTRYLQVFDVVAGSVTLGTTVPKFSYPLPPSGYWEETWQSEARPSFANAITVAVTTTPTGSTGPTTGAVCNFIYK